MCTWVIKGGTGGDYNGVYTAIGMNVNEYKITYIRLYGNKMVHKRDYTGMNTWERDYMGIKWYVHETIWE